MPTRAYYESLWGCLPEGHEPAAFAPRMEFLLAHVPRGARVLDLGCGEGRFAGELARRGHGVVAADVAEEPLRRARARERDLDLRLIGLEGDWPLQDCEFDVVWAGEVIEHVADTARWLSEVRRVLRSGGALVLSTPAHEWLTRVRLGVSRRAFEARFDPRSDHLRFYTARALRGLLEDFGFEQITTCARGGAPGARRVLLASARRARF
jgi:SAM-dependent methyltransferase